MGGDTLGLQILLAVVTAALTISGGVFLFHYQEKKKTERDRLSLATALLAELSSVWERYMAIAGGSVVQTPSGEFWRGYFRPGDNHLAVYDSNTDKLGLFEPALVDALVDVSNHAKGFISRLRTWDRQFELFELQERSADIPTISKSEMVHWFQALKIDHEALEKKILAVRQSLSKVISNR